MKKNFTITTIAVLMASCTTLGQPGKIDLWAIGKASNYSKAAQISYLECSYKWPNDDCMQDNWNKYGKPELSSTSQEERQAQVVAYIRAMEMLGAAQVLRDNNYQCKKINYFDGFVFAKGNHAICDSGFEYQIKLKNNIWNITPLSTPKGEAHLNGTSK